MKLDSFRSQALGICILLMLLSSPLSAQAPPSIQFFMPDGSLPPRELRFTLSSDDGNVNTYYTDSKGRFLLTRALGLKPNARYTVTVESDGASFGWTAHSFKEYSGVYYIIVFLKPFESRPSGAAGVVDLAEVDARTPAEAQAAYEDAMKALKEGRVDEAVAELDRAIAIHPEYFRALNDLGVIYMRMNNLSEAARTLERAINVAPRVFYPRLNLAVVMTRKAEYDSAIGMLEKLHRENPALLEVRTPLADALIAAGRLDEAERHLRAALEDDKLERETSGQAHYLLGLLLNRKNKAEEAVEALREADKLVPNSAQVNLQLGMALMQAKRLQEAERFFLTAYRLGGSEMGAAQLLLGEIYFQQKQYESAMRAFEQYLTDVPGAPNADQVRGVIERIKAALNPAKQSADSRPSY